MHEDTKGIAGHEGAGVVVAVGDNSIFAPRSTLRNHTNNRLSAPQVEGRRPSWLQVGVVDLRGMRVLPQRHRRATLPEAEEQWFHSRWYLPAVRDL